MAIVVNLLSPLLGAHSYNCCKGGPVKGASDIGKAGLRPTAPFWEPQGGAHVWAEGFLGASPPPGASPPKVALVGILITQYSVPYKKSEEAKRELPTPAGGKILRGVPLGGEGPPWGHKRLLREGRVKKPWPIGAAPPPFSPE